MVFFFYIISGTVIYDKGSFCPVVTVACHKVSAVFSMKLYFVFVCHSKFKCHLVKNF